MKLKRSSRSRSGRSGRFELSDPPLHRSMGRRIKTILMVVLLLALAGLGLKSCDLLDTDVTPVTRYERLIPPPTPAAP